MSVFNEFASPEDVENNEIKMFNIKMHKNANHFQKIVKPSKILEIKMQFIH